MKFAFFVQITQFVTFYCIKLHFSNDFLNEILSLAYGGCNAKNRKRLRLSQNIALFLVFCYTKITETRTFCTIYSPKFSAFDT